MSRLVVAEWFQSIQGEGCLAGTPALFIRLSGCNLRCVHCDTAYAWGEGKEMPVEELARIVKQSTLKDVVITGGEPMLQAKGLRDVVNLVDEKRLHLETNGTFWDEELLENFQMVTISPKPTSMAKDGIVHQVLRRFHLWHGPQQVKLLVRDREDWEELEKLVKRYPRWGVEIPLVVQPLCTEEKLDGYLHLCRLLAEELLEKMDGWRLPNIRFIPQIHKLLWWGEEKR